MKRVIVKNLVNEITHQADFASEELAQAWIDENKPRGVWGKVAHTAIVPNTGHPNYYDQAGNILVPEKLPDTIEVPDQFSVEIVDVSDIYAIESEVKLGLERATRGVEIVGRIYALNKSKNLSDQQFLAIMADSTCLLVERLLRGGALPSAKTVIQSMDETYYTTEEKAAIIEAIDNALAG